MCGEREVNARPSRSARPAQRGTRSVRRESRARISAAATLHSRGARPRLFFFPLTFLAG